VSLLALAGPVYEPTDVYADAPRRVRSSAPMPLTPADFSRVYRVNAQAMLTYFQRRLHDAEQATDLLAETFAVAIERAEQFRGSSDAELTSWTWAIARSLLRAAERRGEVERRYAERLGIERRALGAEEVDRLEELAGTSLLGEEVRRQLDRLPPQQRDAVRLRMLDELDYDEVAARLDITEQAARARVSRALRLLRRRMSGDGTEPWG
jgi:RNA polymerase sigma-70 factor, ECF subfamily